MKIKIMLILLCITILNIYADIYRFKILNRELLEDAVTMKIESFDTLQNYEKTDNRESQSKYVKILARNFQYGINESSMYEVLNSRSIIKPDLNLRFKFVALDVEKDRNNEPKKYICALELVGISSKDNSVVFNAFYKKTTKVIDLKDETLGLLLSILNDIDNRFDLLSIYSRRKTYQYYDIDCDKLKKVHYLFCRSSDSKAEDIFYNVADATFNQICVEDDYDIWKIRDTSVVSFLSQCSLNDSLKNKILPNDIRNKLIKKEISTVLLFRNLNSRLPLEFIEEEISDESTFWSPLFSAISNNTKLNEVDDAICDMYLIDVKENKCLIKTKIFGDSGDDVANHAIDAIGEFKNRGGDILRCFN